MPTTTSGAAEGTSFPALESVPKSPSPGLVGRAQSTLRTPDSRRPSTLTSRPGEAGRTVFHSSHVLSEVDRTCTRVAVLRAGRLVAVERIDELRASLTRKMVVRFGNEVPETELEIPGSRLVERDGNEVVFEVRGELDPLIRLLARHSVQHMVFPEPELDDAFRDYYGGESGSAR